jgi:predicted GNAT family acetyltransferase
MWRMVLKPEDFPGGEDQGCVALTRDDSDRLRDLFGEHPDRPDSFHPSQLDRGVFRAIAEGQELVAVAGTHVVSDWASVAAVGSVYTRPDRRGRGYGRKASAAVAADLLRRGIRTIVLNVAMDNAPALAVYRRLGFMPFCGYYEGVGVLINSGES